MCDMFAFSPGKPIAHMGPFAACHRFQGGAKHLFMDDVDSAEAIRKNASTAEPAQFDHERFFNGPAFVLTELSGIGHSFLVPQYRVS